MLIKLVGNEKWEWNKSTPIFVVMENRNENIPNLATHVEKCSSKLSTQQNIFFINMST